MRLPGVLVTNSLASLSFSSLGVIAYVLLCGFPPFHAENEYKTLQLVKDETTPIEFPSPIWDDVSQEARDFILRLLTRDPHQRPSAQQALQDPWLHHQHVQPDGLPRQSCFSSNASTNSMPSLGDHPSHGNNNISSSKRKPTTATNNNNKKPIIPHSLAASTPVRHHDRNHNPHHPRNIQMISKRREGFHRFLKLIKLRKRSHTTVETIDAII